MRNKSLILMHLCMRSFANHPISKDTVQVFGELPTQPRTVNTYRMLRYVLTVNKLLNRYFSTETKLDLHQLAGMQVGGKKLSEIWESYTQLIVKPGTSYKMFVSRTRAFTWDVVRSVVYMHYSANISNPVMYTDWNASDTDQSDRYHLAPYAEYKVPYGTRSAIIDGDGADDVPNTSELLGFIQHTEVFGPISDAEAQHLHQYYVSGTCNEPPAPLTDLFKSHRLDYQTMTLIVDRLKPYL